MSIKRINATSYEVVREKTVTVEVSAIGTALLLAAVLDDGYPYQEAGTATRPKYRFKIRKEHGYRHRLRIACDFPPGAADDAKYQMEVASGGQVFRGPSIKKANKNWTVSLRFKSVAPV